MSHSAMEDDGRDLKSTASKHIESFLHDLTEDCKNHPSVAFVSTTPGDIRRDPRTKSAIGRLSARITALEEAESTIQRERVVAEKELAFLHARLAPISACPNEIIGKIMMVTYCSTLEDAGHCADPTKILLSISQVSQLWRDVSISLTQVWARIHVEWDPKQRALWLERSGTRPLDVYLLADSHLPEAWKPTEDIDTFGERDLLLHPSRWRSLSLRNCVRFNTGEFLRRLTHHINLKSLESLKLSFPVFGRGDVLADFRLGVHPESGSALRNLSLQDTNIEALDLAADNLVTMTLSGIAEGDDPHFWARVLGCSERLERLILSRLLYHHNTETGGGPAIPIRAHLRSLVLGNGNGRKFFRYMICEIKAPALLSLDICLPKCSEQYGREITTMLMEFLKSSPLIQDLTIRINRSVAIKILNALRAPLTDSQRVSSTNIYLPHLRRLKFDQLFDNHSERLLEEFLDELEYFLIFRSKVYYYEVESRRWRQKGRTNVLESLTLESFLYDQADHVEDFAQHFISISDWKPTAYTFQDLDERRSHAYDADTTWDDVDDYSGDDNGLDALTR